MASLATLPLSSQAEPFTLADQLQACRDQVEVLCLGLPAPYPAFTLVFSITEGDKRAHVLHVNAGSFDQAWREGSRQTLAAAQRQKLKAPGLRVDWVEDASAILAGTAGTLVAKADG